MSLFGSICLLLSYYYCRHCKNSQKPWDERLGLTSQGLTIGARQVISQAGAITSFGHASDQTLRTMCGIKLSESTVRRTTEQVGEEVAEHLAQGETLGPQVEPWQWQRDASGKTCAYLSLDHTGIRQQSPGGGRADGRMAAVGMIYNVNSPHDDRKVEDHQVRYLSGFYELDDLGRQLRREAHAVGIEQADQQIVLSDGGSGLEDMMRRWFPKAVCILDFWHAKEHLVELAQELFPSDEAGRKAWTDQWCHNLKHQGGQAILAQLQKLSGESNLSDSARESIRKQIVYFTNNVHRMDYPQYVARGWQIGSGPVESACKAVIGNRLKGGGMRWSKNGSHAICVLRALYLSEPICWQAFWNAA